MQQVNENQNIGKSELNGGYFGGADSFSIEKKYFEDLQLLTLPIDKSRGF